MNRYALIAIAALLLVGFSQVAGHAYNGNNSGGGCTWMYMYPQGYDPSQAQGAGPSGTAQGPIPVLVCPAPCCPADVEARCGAFCEAGNTAPGWPYGWCDEYWLRPDTNY